MSSSTQDRSRQRGFSLVEVMTAMAVFIVIFVSALLLYDRANRVFTNSTQAATMQQTTRVGFDKLVQDIRLAGFDYKRGGVPTSAFNTRRASQAYVVGQMALPDVANGHVYKCTTAGTTAATSPTWNAGSGSTTTDGGVVWTEAGTIQAAFDPPDEQIEYAWHSAITIRANYNYDAPDDAKHYEHGRESELESAYFPIVTTNNDEIVTYVLHSDKPGAANSDSVTFYADVNNGGSPSRTAYPGGNPERLITIDNVDLSNNNPPYTLYRVTLAPDGSPVRTPLADNIRSLTFEYFTDQQGLIPLKDLSNPPVNITDVGGGGQFDPSNAATRTQADRLVRGNIRSIKVTLVGMNETKDGSYTDPTDTVAPNYRKISLATTIVPRNLGIIAQPQSPLQPPPKPVNVAVCYGYCGIPFVTWLPGDPSSYSTGSTGAESFSIAYDTNQTGPFSNVEPAGTLTSYAVDMTQIGNAAIAGNTYYFKVIATNAAGSAPSDVVGPISIKNSTKPSPPGGVSAVGSGGASTPKISLYWTSPTSNSSGAPSCTSGTTTVTNVADELKGFQIFRSTSSGFTPNSSNMIVDAGVSGPVGNGVGGWSFDDTTVSACTPYYYKIRAVEWCNAADNMNTTGDKNDAISNASAEVSATVTANQASTPTGFMVDPTTTCGATQCSPVTIKWNKVTTDTGGGAINVDTYEVYRKVRHGTYTSPVAKVATLTGMVGASSPISWSEPSPLQAFETSAPFDQDFYDYYVIAKFACGDATQTSTITVPSNCDTGVTITSTNAVSGNGTTTSPWVAPSNSSLVVKLNQGASPYTAITAGTVSLDGGAQTALSGGSSPPWSTSWTDTGDGATHTMTFTATTTCTQALPTVYIQASPVGCHLQTEAVDGNTIKLATTPEAGSDYELDVTLKNLSQDTVTVTSFVITDSVPKKGNWNYLEYPSGTKTQTASTSNLPAAGGNSGAVTYTKTFDFTSVAAADKTIGPGASKVYKLLYTVGSGGNAVADTNITSFVVNMKTAAGGTTTFNCAIK